MRKLLNILLLSLVMTLASSGAAAKNWPVTDFGAIGDGTTLNTAFIQKAIDACHAAGGGTVGVPNGRFVTGTLLLKDNVTLHLAKGAALLGSERPEDYRSIDPFTDATGQQRGSCLIGALGAKNIAITGEGTIDGNGIAFQAENLAKRYAKSEIKTLVSNRPFLLRFVKSTDIQLHDVHLRQPAAWTCHFFQCDTLLVEGVKIFSHANKNNDGIDLDSSRHATIRDCDIDTGDDAMCFKSTSPQPCRDIHVSNCRLKSDWGAIKIGTESMGDFSKITVEHCRVYDTRGGGIKLLSADGANISNITIDHIEMDQVDMPIFIRLGERLLTYREAPKQAVGSINNVKISNITATARGLELSRITPPAGIFITGTPGHKVGKLTLEDIHIRLPGGGTAAQASTVVEEQETKYPEFSFFGVLPAFGIYARHVGDLSISNLSIETAASDLRHAALLEDVSQHAWTQVQVNGQARSQPVIKPSR